MGPLVPLMGLAEQAGLSELIGQRVRFKTSRVASAGANPAGKRTSIAGLAADSNSRDELDVILSCGMPPLRRCVRTGHAGSVPA